MFQNYIAEEIATDCAEGVISRRDALHKLTTLGLTTAAAAALITACSPAAKPVPAASSSTATGPVVTTAPSAVPADQPPPGVQGALPVESVTFQGSRGELQGAWSKATQAKGAVLVIHENRGLTEHIRTIPGRLAGAGYSALAIDLLSEEGGTGKFPSESDATKALMAAPADRFVADLKSGLDELERREPGKKLAVTGFCFGGGLTWALLGSKEPRLAAAAPFYGPLKEGEAPPDFSGDEAAVIAFYGADDHRVTSTLGEAEAALKAAGLTYRLVVEQGANHAFFNDTGPRYVPAAAHDAWKQLLDWFGRHLG